jgi:hypothetical protein
MKSTKTHTPTSRKQAEATAEVIKLGMDIHKTKYVVIRQIDNQAAQSPQSFGGNMGWWQYGVGANMESVQFSMHSVKT